MNKISMDLNTASAALLECISGINKIIERNIVDFRESNGRFTNRKQLLKVVELEPRAYEQYAADLDLKRGI